MDPVTLSAVTAIITTVGMVATPLLAKVLPSAIEAAGSAGSRLISVLRPSKHEYGDGAGASVATIAIIGLPVVAIGGYVAYRLATQVAHSAVDTAISVPGRVAKDIFEAPVVAAERAASDASHAIGDFFKGGERAVSDAISSAEKAANDASKEIGKLLSGW